MKIAFDSQIFAVQKYGGISRYFCSLAAHLAEVEGVDIGIIAPLYINGYLGNLPRGMVSGIKVPNIPRMGRVFLPFGLRLARGAVARFSPQIVHETYYTARPVAPEGVPSVVTVYDMIHERFPLMFLPHDRTREWKRLATQRAARVICISENTRKDLLELFDLPEEKVTVVHLGFAALTPTIEKVEKKKPYLLYVGDRGGWKNFAGFLRAFASSPWLRHRFDVVCFGGGKFSGQERKLISDLKFSTNQLTQISGSDNQLANLYAGAALFVYPSLYEGFGIPPLEAMSLGCPVACSNTSSIPEVVSDSGEYFDPTDLDSMRTAMERVLNSPSRRAELIDRGKLRCAQFSWERCAEKTLAVYSALM